MFVNGAHLDVQLPGFRFHPTEEELLDFYLKKMVLEKNVHFDIIDVLNIYRYEPCELPGLAKIGEREWYFFVPRDRKHGNGGRPNRTTEDGFWKATGSDRKIFGLSNPKRHLGLKKTLVFYKGRAPKGTKTDWVMNEYRLPDSCPLPKDIVLCKIYRKATSLKALEQMAAIEEKTHTVHNALVHSPPSPTTPAMDNSTISFSSHSRDSSQSMPPHNMAMNEIGDENMIGFAEEIELKEEEISNNLDPSSQILTSRNEKPAELQLPKYNMDLIHDPFWTQMHSPWLDNMILLTPCANVLNF